MPCGAGEDAERPARDLEGRSTTRGPQRLKVIFRSRGIFGLVAVIPAPAGRLWKKWITRNSGGPHPQNLDHDKSDLLRGGSDVTRKRAHAHYGEVGMGSANEQLDSKAEPLAAKGAYVGFGTMF